MDSLKSSSREKRGKGTAGGLIHQQLCQIGMIPYELTTINSCLLPFVPVTATVKNNVNWFSFVSFFFFFFFFFLTEHKIEHKISQNDCWFC